MHVSAQMERQWICEWLLTSAVIYVIECARSPMQCVEPLWTSTKTLWLIHARTSQPCDTRCDFQGPPRCGPVQPVVADERPADTKTSGRTGQCVVMVDSGWPSVAAVLADFRGASSPLRGNGRPCLIARASDLSARLWCIGPQWP